MVQISRDDIWVVEVDLGGGVSIHRQSRWLYGCWPLKGTLSQPSEAKARTKAKNLALLSSLPQYGQFEGEHTPGILKVLPPPRQSRGISFWD
jgi:hypothetical protein